MWLAAFFFPSEMNKIFIGVAWPYASGPRHIGHAAGAYIPADVFARYHRMKGDEVLMVSGSDQHGTPITVRADREKTTPQEIAERFHKLHEKCFRRLGISYDLYWKTSESNHKWIVQDVFLTLKKRGHIYESVMTSPFCTNCNRFMPDRYIEGECPHCHFDAARGDQCDRCGKLLDPFDLLAPTCKICGKTPAPRETKHFFMRLSAFESPLRKWLEGKEFWRPHVLNLTRAWLEEGLKDRAVTRDLDWGVEIPIGGYEGKRIYVWFEAVIGYLSTSVEWARRSEDAEKWKQWWYNPQARHYYFIGKDNIPFHTIVWPAILTGYDEKLQLPYDVPANAYLNTGGEKMSAGRGIGVWLPELLDAFDPDALRYYVCAIMPENRDTEFTFEDFAAKNNSELLAVYGNFVHRTLTFTAKHFDGKVPSLGFCDASDRAMIRAIEEQWKKVGQNLEYAHFKDALKDAIHLARLGNQYFDRKAPWDLIKRSKEQCATAIHICLRLCKALALIMSPFIPFSSQKLWQMLGYSGEVHERRWEEALEEIPEGQRITVSRPLFVKIEIESSEGAATGEERFDIRVAQIVEVRDHPNADKLYVLQVDLGDERRQIVAGIKENYTEEQLKGKRICLLVNLQPTRLRGVESNGMLLAGEDEKDVALVLPPDDVPLGSQLFGRKGAPILAFSEFERYEFRVEEEGKVFFLGADRAVKTPLRVGDEYATIDKQMKEGTRVH